MSSFGKTPSEWGEIPAAERHYLEIASLETKADQNAELEKYK